MKTDNELIAEFMGFTTHKGSLGDTYTHPDLMGVYGGSGLKFKYDTSWDWLMPVIAKIAEYRMAYPKESAWVCDCKIVVYQSALYREVVSFIRFYNKQNT